MTELLRRHPEIESIPIEKPFIVVGMPRSGTTHLVNLLAADPRRRALPYWESQEPLPIPGQGPDVHGVDPRYTRAKNEHDAMMVSAPATAAMHDRFPEAIEEEVEILDLDFAGYVLEWHARVPGWRDFYLGHDQTPHYAYMKTVLQVDLPGTAPRHVGAEVAAAPRATRPADDDVPRRHIVAHPPRPGGGGAVDDHDDAPTAPARRTEHRPEWYPTTGPTASGACSTRACATSTCCRPSARRHRVLPRVHERTRWAPCNGSTTRAGIELTPEVRPRLAAYQAAHPAGKDGRSSTTSSGTSHHTRRGALPVRGRTSNDSNVRTEVQ